MSAEMFNRASWLDICDLAEANGVRPEIVYAMRVTERILTEENRHLVSREAREEWDAAVRRYREGKVRA